MNENSQPFVEMHALVSGVVQGVGFRATTRYHALQLKIKGTVRNLPDGRVEIWAEGEKKDLEELIYRIRKEIGESYITEIAIEYKPSKQLYTDFLIIR